MKTNGLAAIISVFISTLGFGQVYTIKVKMIQQFEHPYGMSISQAIEDSVFVYKNASNTDAKYVFDLNKKTFVARLGDGRIKRGQIVQTFNATDYFVVEIDVDGVGAVCKLYLDNDNQPIFTVEWVDGARVEGFFTGEMAMREDLD